jgi:hypothetical protein
MNDMYELWWRFPYKNDLRERKVTLAIRPGDRRRPKSKGVSEGETIRNRVLAKPGNEDKGELPIFDSYSNYAKVCKIKVLPWSELCDADLKGATLDCLTKDAVWHNLGLTYNREMTNNDLVSLIEFEYVERGDK